MSAPRSNLSTLPARCSEAEVQRWTRTHGVITQRVQGSHIDISVRLFRLTRAAFWTVVVAAGVTGTYVFWNILYAFVSGRVQAVLDAAMQGVR